MLTQSTKLKMDNCTMNDLSENDEKSPSASSSENNMNLTSALLPSTNQFCRLCAHETDKSIFIFGGPGVEQHIALKINAYLPITVRKSDVLPKQICMNCINKLQILSEFAENCLHAEQQLKKVLEPKILKSRRIKSDISLIKKGDTSFIDINKICQTFNHVAKSPTNMDKPMLLISDNNAVTCPLCCNGNMNAIQGPEKLVESNSLNCDIQQVGTNSSNQPSGLVSSTLQNRVDFFNEEKVDSKHEDHNCDELWQNKVMEATKISYSCEKLCADLEAHSNNIETIAENNQHVANKENSVVLCQICGKTFQCIDSCMDHCKCHFQTQDSCTFCNLHFNNEQKWLNHLKEHLLNTQLQVRDHYLCQDCNQLFETLAVFNMHSCPHKQYSKCDKVENNFAPDNTIDALQQPDPQENHSSNGLNQEQMIPEECQAAMSIQNPKETHTCQYCMQIFAKKADCMSHIQTVHTDIPQYTCEVCDEKFLNQFVLLYHYASHTNLTSLQCAFCNLTFSTQPALHQHLLSQHPKLLPSQACYKCNTCQETFTNLNDSVNHISSHLPNSFEQNHEIEEVHISQLYMCEYCESCFTTKSLLFQHYFIHNKDNRYSCKLCNTTFTSYGRLSKHKLLHNEQNKHNFNNTTDNSSVIKLFVCQECEKCYTQWNSLNNHRRNCHQNNHSYTCKICNETFSVYAEYQDHRKIHPAQVKTEADNNEKEYLCDYCQKTFHHHSTLALHQRVHLKGQPYACEICGETFRLKSTYDKHFRKHTGIKPYICDVCGKGFTQNSGLYTHRRVHTGEKPYACDLCGKNFRLKHDRDNHRRCHTGERPYQCSYCGKAFRTSHDHRQHLLIHTGQRPYRCDYCSKGFRRINGLNVHKRIHTGEKPYGCAICGRHFTQKGDMMKHCKTQHGNTF